MTDNDAKFVLALFVLLVIQNCSNSYVLLSQHSQTQEQIENTKVETTYE